jgi:hypothetical protein
LPADRYCFPMRLGAGDQGRVVVPAPPLLAQSRHELTLTHGG